MSLTNQSGRRPQKSKWTNLISTEHSQNMRNVEVLAWYLSIAWTGTSILPIQDICEISPFKEEVLMSIRCFSFCFYGS